MCVPHMSTRSCALTNAEKQALHFRSNITSTIAVQDLMFLLGHGWPQSDCAMHLRLQNRSIHCKHVSQQAHLNLHTLSNKQGSNPGSISAHMALYRPPQCPAEGGS